MIAKAHYSHLIARISGRVGNVVYASNQGGDYVRSYCEFPYNPNTERQQLIRNAFKSLTGIYASLTDTQKKIWDRYASMLSARYTGIAAFLHLNLTLAGADHPALTHFLIPPLSPSTPRSVWEITVTALSSFSNLIAWDFPSVSSLYVPVYYRLPKSYPDFPGAHQRFAGTARSDSLCLTHSHTFSSATIVKYFCYSLDIHGRLSPRTHEVKLYIP